MRILFEDLQGVVCAPIIDGIYPEILMGLHQHAVESAVHIIFNVVAGDDDIYFALSWRDGWQRGLRPAWSVPLMIFVGWNKLSRHCQKRVTLIRAGGNPGLKRM